MLALAGYTLAVAAVFGLFAMAFVYTVEDRFMDRLLVQEAERQRAHRAQHGNYVVPGSAFIALHTGVATLPRDLATQLAAEPLRREFAGEAGRHYHLLPLETAGRAPWLVAEVSRQLVVRPIRGELLAWLVGWGLGAVLLALLIGQWLARRVSAPLETLAGRVSAIEPQALPGAVSTGLPSDEVGAVGRAFDHLLARMRAFVEREQAFTRDASHELRTPLSVLRLGLERQLAAPLADAEQRRELAAMHASTLLMQQTVETLLVLAREDERAARLGAASPSTASTRVEQVPVLPLLEQWVLAHAPWLDGQALSLRIDLAPHDSLAVPSPVLQLVLAALLGNAFDHGTPPGAVRVAMDGGALVVENPVAEVDAVAADDQASPRLGLAILHRVLERCGARLVFERAGLVARARVEVLLR
jgi:signal transduction histidine kinase